MEDFKDLKLKNNNKENDQKKEENRTEDIKASDIDWKRVVGLWVC